MLKRIITIISVILFLLLTYYESTQGVKEYIPDTILFMILTLILFSLYKKLNLNILSYSSFILAMLFHNLGAFGFYNNSPIPFQWDHLTHIVGSFAITLILFQFLKNFLTTSKFKNIYLIIILILASLGAGVIIEYYEFIGYFLVGEGMGGLGHGVGDIATELGNSAWFNTMFDLIYNLIGTLIALPFAFLSKK